MLKLWTGHEISKQMRMTFTVTLTFELGIRVSSSACRHRLLIICTMLYQNLSRHVEVMAWTRSGRKDGRTDGQRQNNVAPLFAGDKKGLYCYKFRSVMSVIKRNMHLHEIHRHVENKALYVFSFKRECVYGWTER